MKTFLARALFWLPRGLGILLGIFLAVLALDVFGQGGNPGNTLIAFLIHLLPAAMVGIALGVAWRRDGMGAFLFFMLAGLFVLRSRGANWILPGWLGLIGGFFLLNWGLRCR